MEVRLKRAYDAPSPEDGERFLVDRLWPRGVRKETLKVSAWLKDVAPSDELRRWFDHDSARWEEFRRRYRDELRSRGDVLKPLRDAASKGPITLVYAAREPVYNHTTMLREMLLKSKAGGS